MLKETNGQNQLFNNNQQGTETMTQTKETLYNESRSILSAKLILAEEIKKNV